MPIALTKKQKKTKSERKNNKAQTQVKCNELKCNSRSHQQSSSRAGSEQAMKFEIFENLTSSQNATEIWTATTL